MNCTFSHYFDPYLLPKEWDDTIGKENTLLSTSYLLSLVESKPDNMSCCFVAYFSDEKLIGGALFQQLNFYTHNTFQKNEISCSFRNFFAKKFAKNVLIIGNNLLSGQNGIYFSNEAIDEKNQHVLLEKSIQYYLKTIEKTDLIVIKDHTKKWSLEYQNIRKSYFPFTVQPNMILEISKKWGRYEDYFGSFTKKYRARAKTARQKSKDLITKELSLEDLNNWKTEMHKLYQNVAKNAPFNTFFLNELHFYTIKCNMKERFKVFGYFQENKMVGFYTLFINSDIIETYFLGYDNALQKEKQIYLNMLLDMVKFGIDHRMNKVVFGRTALEIKSTIGAEPHELFGLIKHSNPLINPIVRKVFSAIAPSDQWVQRHPFGSEKTTI